ncbi:uncharacterized protein LOC123208252 [Mangifera indica]|uniref:uncharacterized protein LOC123208227 n=1 Tax=Mangifera indica TaxID=29780 RepID=UPI001CFB2B5B|nr:uncharacterized protein LOC123208227 [Mangifera indica]XP_044481561.1 uncharacterized protein LOC123208252 [Mangifera indica]
MLKHVWRLLTDHSSIWSSWVRQILLRGRSFWHIRVPSGVSWAWRKILMSRDWCRGLFVSCIGNGRDTSLWLDYWLPQGRLCDLFSFRVLSATGLTWDAKVSDIIRDGLWAFPYSCSELQQVWDSIRFFPRIPFSDHVVWRGHPSGRFSIDSAWDFIRPRRDVNSTHHLLWFSGHIPRHSFILWLATLGRLRTMDRLQHFGIVHSTACVLCGSAIETHDHLFFSCHFSTYVWREIKARTLQTWPSFSWASLVHWASLHLRQRKHFGHLISRLSLSATVYFLWYERNNRVFHQASRHRREVVRDICDVVRARIIPMGDSYDISPQLRAIWHLPS